MLSIIIPAKNEKHLERTIAGLKEKARGEIEILAEEDGGIGQRALTNKLAKQAKGEWLMKCDAHISFLTAGFDKIMLQEMGKDMIMAPYLFRLDEKTWRLIPKPAASVYYFDTNYVMQYGQEAEEPEDRLNETMCLQGSCWLVSQENYWKWNLCDETLGSWGGQAAELGIKAFLNGGRCVTNKEVLYGHLFREQEADFPYKRNKKIIKQTLKNIKKKFPPKMITELITRFNYPCDWHANNTR